MNNEELKNILKKEWDYEKNNGLNIDDFSFGSHKKIWWLCSLGHSWEAEIKRRYAGSGCPYCSNKKILKGFNDLATTNPELAKEWNYEKNEIKPNEVIAGNHSKVWWKCNNNHEWQATLLSRKQGGNCPICSNKKIIIGENDLATTNPELLKEWNYKKNQIKPENVTSGADRKVWWICERGHEWQALIKNRKLGQSCPYCSNTKVLSGFNDLATTHPLLAKEWNYEKNGRLKPEDILAGSNKNIWWKCEKGHEWKTKSLYRSMGENCPYCQNKSVLSGYNDLATTHPKLLKEWNYEKNGELKPQNVVSGSSIKVWWKCKKGHEWKTDIKNRASGHNCPKCIEELKTSLPERTIFYYIKKYFNDAVNNYYLDDLEKKELDIYIPSIKTGIEYDGERFHDKEKDKYKDKLCFENNIKLYRVREKNCPKYDSTSLKIYLKENNNISLCEAIEKLLTYLNVKEFNVDIEKDTDDIYALIDYIEKENSILNKNPALAKEWNYEKNGRLKPEEFSIGSHYKVWWKCEKGHEWRAEIKSRNTGRNCPYCSNTKVLSGFNDLATTNPELLKEWNYKRNQIKPTEIMSGSEKKVWWKCSTCGNEWETMIKTRKRGSNCPKCLGVNK